MSGRTKKDRRRGFAKAGKGLAKRSELLGPPPNRRRAWVAGLNRKPRMWDVLWYEAAGMLGDVCRASRPRVKRDLFSFRESQLWGIGWMFACGASVVVEQLAARLVRDGAVNPLAALAVGDRAFIERIISDLKPAYAELLRRYAIIAKGGRADTADPDVNYLSEILAGALAEFLAEECVSGTKLHRCVTEPLADPGIILPDNGRPLRPVASTGDPSRDVYELGLVVQDEFGPSEVKSVLVQMVTNDPWLFAEFEVFVQEEASRVADDSMGPDDVSSTRAIELTDRFIFQPSRFDGRTPPQLLLDRQVWISDAQRRRLTAWTQQPFTSLFNVAGVNSPYLDLVELRNGKPMRALVTKREAIGLFKEGEVFMSRLVPWDEHWVLSGVQSRLGKLKKLKLDELFEALEKLEPDTVKQS